LSLLLKKLVRKGKISYGLSSYGYDMRVADEFYIFHNAYPTEIIDPKNFKENYFIKHKGKFCIIPPNSFVLARSVEYFRIPRNVLAIVLGKSSYARCGIIVNVTPLEPRNIDLCVTPDHLLLVRKRWRKYFEFVKAKDVYGKYNYELKRDAKWKGEKREYFYLPRMLDENRLNKFKNLTSILEMLEQNNLTTVGIKNNLNKVPHRTLLFYLDELYSKGFLEKSAIFKRRKIGANRIFVWGLKKNLNELHDFYLKPIKIKMKDWLKFFGIWLAEGNRNL
jgi:hypothetical protein